MHAMLFSLNSLRSFIAKIASPLQYIPVVRAQPLLIQKPK